MRVNEVVSLEQKHISPNGVETAHSIYGQQAAAAMGVITLAFSTDPVARWMYPDPSEYLRHFPEFIRAFAGQSFEKGTAYLAPNAAGAALWLGPGIEPEAEPLINLFSESTSSEVQRDLFPIFEQMGEYHPAYPHWYLPMIGVDTHMQGGGVGASLMTHALAYCDADGSTAYLESSNPRNIPLYERFGFEVVGEIKVGAAPPLYPMLRQPQRTREELLNAIITKEQ